MEFGLTTFAEITDSTVSPGERLRQVVEEMMGRSQRCTK